MIEKLKLVWRRAVIIVAIGGTFSAALWQAMQEQDVDCAQWALAAARANDIQEQHVFYTARRQGTTLPDTLGTCAAGVCSITPSGCTGSVQYKFDLGPFVSVGGNNWQVVKIEAHPLVAGRLKAFADANPTTVKWFGSFGQLVSSCLALTTGTNCRNMIAPLHDCWLQADGTLCRYSRTTRIDGPGLESDGACSPVAGSKPFPCVVSRGAGSESEDAAKLWADAELQ